MDQDTEAGDPDGHVIDRLTEYFSRDLNEREDLAIDAHLLRCAACRREYEELGAIASRISTAPSGTFEFP